MNKKIIGEFFVALISAALVFAFISVSAV